MRVLGTIGVESRGKRKSLLSGLDIVIIFIITLEI